MPAARWIMRFLGLSSTPISSLMRSGTVNWAIPRTKLKRPRNLASLRSGGCPLIPAGYPAAPRVTADLEVAQIAVFFFVRGMDSGGSGAGPSAGGSDDPAASPTPAQAGKAAARPQASRGAWPCMDQRQRSRRHRPALRAPRPLVRLGQGGEHGVELVDDVALELDLSVAIVRCRALRDQHQPAAALERDARESGNRMDLERRADRDHQVGGRRQLVCAPQRVFGEEFPEEDDVGLERRDAGGALRRAGRILLDHRDDL